MTPTEPDLARWHRDWHALGAPTGHPALGDALLACWREPHRCYHTLQHLGECLALLDQHASAAERPGEVAIALWFHDAVYARDAADNERRSADWARRAALESGLDGGVGQRLFDLVMTTRHDVEPGGPDAALLVDIDLAILGAPPARFDEYERQVRVEYAHLPEGLYRGGRTRILGAFADRPRIYRTACVRAERESQARANLARSIASLQE